MVKSTKKKSPPTRESGRYNLRPKPIKRLLFPLETEDSNHSEVVEEESEVVEEESEVVEEESEVVEEESEVVEEESEVVEEESEVVEEESEVVEEESEVVEEESAADDTGKTPEGSESLEESSEADGGEFHSENFTEAGAEVSRNPVSSPDRIHSRASGPRPRSSSSTLWETVSPSLHSSKSDSSRKRKRSPSPAKEGVFSSKRSSKASGASKISTSSQFECGTAPKGAKKGTKSSRSPPKPRKAGEVSSPISSHTTLKSAQERNKNLEDELATLRNQLAAERNERATSAHKHAQETEELKKKLLAADEDTYPYKFWPSLPWDPEPVDLVVPPYQLPRDLHEKQREACEKRWLDYSLTMLGESNLPWHGVKYLGSGAYGSVGLWVKVDEHDNIIDRIVAKDSGALESDFGDLWESADFWRGKLPMEIHNHKLIDGARTDGSHRNLIRHRGYRLMMRNRMYRLYLDFCTKRDLWVATMPRRWGDAGETDSISEYYKEYHWKMIPESFLWYIFDELAQACLYLQQGDLNEPRQGWRPMVHNDLHLANVLLDERKPHDDSIDPVFPRVVLADFGRTFYELNPAPHLSIEERDNPLKYRVTVTDCPDWPPETHQDHEIDTKITAKTDVWFIGAIMWTLISHYHDEEGPVLENSIPASTESFEDENILQGHLFPVQIEYSHDLRYLVGRCLAYEPDERPTLANIREAIDQAKPDPPYEDPELYFLNDLDAFEIGRTHRPEMSL